MAKLYFALVALLVCASCASEVVAQKTLNGDTAAQKAARGGIPPD